MKILYNIITSAFSLILLTFTYAWKSLKRVDLNLINPLLFIITIILLFLINNPHPTRWDFGWWINIQTYIIYITGEKYA